jgi:hypothetical protein
LYRKNVLTVRGHGRLPRLTRLADYLCDSGQSSFIQNMISAGTPVRRTSNREPLADITEGNAGHRCCNITDRGPQKRLNYNDEGLKLRDAWLTKQYLLLFVLHSNNYNIYGHVVEQTIQIQKQRLLYHFDRVFRGCDVLH